MATFKTNNPNRAAEADRQGQQTAHNHRDRESEDYAPEHDASDLAIAAGAALATAQDPLNKALRGIGDHLQHKPGQMNQPARQAGEFYERLGLQSPNTANNTAQMDQYQASREDNTPELDF